MTQRFESEELDEASLEYLRTAHRHDGDGMPGIYLDPTVANLASAWLPVFGVSLGLVLIAVTLFFTWGSLADPINAAMLQTAGLFLGMWLIVAWFRIRAWRKRPDYVGYFKLIDPLYLWQASGRGVWVSPLSGLRDADVDHTYDDKGNYSTSKVTVRLEKETIVIDVKSQYLAERLEGYLNLLKESNQGQPAERGFETLEELNAREADEQGEELPPPIRRQVDAIPEPHKVRSVTNWWPYPILVMLFAVVFFLSWLFCTATRDDEIFALVREHRPPDLRAYLIDRRNTRHRHEVLQLLARWHDQAAQRVDARGGDPRLTAGLASLIRSLGQETRPVITIAVKQSQDADARDQNTLFAPEKMQELRKDLARKIAQSLTLLFEHDLADYGEVEEGAAMIQIASKATKFAPGAGYLIDWTVTIQSKADAPPFVWKTQTPPVLLFANVADLWVSGAQNRTAIPWIVAVHAAHLGTVSREPENLKVQYDAFKKQFDKSLTK